MKHYATNTTFQPGDVVEARVTAQGLTRGNRYRVTGVDQHHTAWGNFVTYTVALLAEDGVTLRTNDGTRYEHGVVNAHLILAKVAVNEEELDRRYHRPADASMHDEEEA